MSISSAFEGAPFTPAQSDWLGSFLAGVFGLEARAATPRPAAPADRAAVAADRQHPYAAEVLRIQSLTRGDSDKDVRLVALNLRGSGVRYRAGDSLGVYPENSPDLVRTIL